MIACVDSRWYQAVVFPEVTNLKFEKHCLFQYRVPSNTVYNGASKPYEFQNLAYKIRLADLELSTFINGLIELCYKVLDVYQLLKSNLCMFK